MDDIDSEGCLWAFIITAILASFLSLPTLGILWLLGGIISAGLGVEDFGTSALFGVVFVIGLFVGVWALIYKTLFHPK